MTAADDILDLQEERERKKSQYISKRDMAIAFPFLVLLGVGIYFFYNKLLDDAEESLCRKNLKEMYTALGLYFANNGDCFPPAYVAADSGAPLYENEGTNVNSWVYLISPGLSTRASFKCPTAEDSELVWNVIPQDVAESRLAGQKDKVLEKRLESSYGFYRQWELKPVNYMGDPASQVIVAETSNAGERTTFDPKPILDGEGRPQRFDGYLIGWDTGNDKLEITSKFVSRLAFPGTRGGAFRKDGAGRHGDEINALAGDGHIIRLRSQSALIERSNGQAVGYWGDR